jgi:hypothetical protein
MEQPTPFQKLRQECDLIRVLESFEPTRKVKDQIRYAERRIKELDPDSKSSKETIERVRERKSFVRRVEQEVGEDKLRNYFNQNGLAHIYPSFKHMTLREFLMSDVLDWPSLTEADLRYVLYIR